MFDFVIEYVLRSRIENIIEDFCYVGVLGCFDLLIEEVCCCNGSIFV